MNCLGFVAKVVKWSNEKEKVHYIDLISFISSQVLDRLLLYLRIVHSIDYYNNCEYPSEDEMPNRCGMIHVRGPIPPNRIAHGEGEHHTTVYSTLAGHHTLTHY